MAYEVDEISPERLKRLEKDWTKIAGVPVEVEQQGGAFYGYTTELGALRLYYTYRHSDPDEIKAAFSQNLNTWYFRLEV